MTVAYNLAVSTSHPWTFIQLFFRLISHKQLIIVAFRWDGSVWKAIWVQYSVFLVLYFFVSGIFRTLLTTEQQEIFATIVEYTDSRLKYIPLDLMLGFFVAGVLFRFWYLYNIIGWMDNIALMTALYVRGDSERARQYRRNIVRYSQLTQVLVFRDLSMRCRKRFPTLDCLVAAGFMMPHEKENFDQIQYNYNKYFMPFNWAWSLIYNARKEGLIEGDYYVTILSEEVKKFRTDLAWLCNYDWVPLPMIYPTIVYLAVHMYFLVCLVARQFVGEFSSSNDNIDLVFPFMTSLQFLFYMGWLKVSETLLNPWGEDDDDFETNILIDRNIAMGLKIVDDGYGKTPELRKDAFWDDQWVPLYTEETAQQRKYQAREGSLAHIKLPTSVSEVRMVPLGSSANLTSLKERIVPVNPEDVSEKPTLGFIGRSASIIGLAPRKTFSSRNLSDRRTSLKYTMEEGSLRLEELHKRAEESKNSVEKED